MKKLPFKKGDYLKSKTSGQFFKVKSIQVLDNRNLFFIKDVKSKATMIRGCEDGISKDYELLKDFEKIQRFEKNRKCALALMDRLKYSFYGYLGFIFIPPALYLVGAIAYQTFTGEKAPKWNNEMD